uniref:Phosphatidylinositol transfer protein, cytoplasmic 1 [Trichechus manatus latirostris] n=1 Tax=Lepeophtheirus salmonis TaxID=72036 RepID=A0A0K2TQC1_LEPSM
MITKEYRICMPLSVDEYHVGQLYMIAKHSAEQSKGGEGVEVVENRPHHDPVHGDGRFTEKRIYLSSRLPSFIKNLVPRIFYITEKAWNLVYSISPKKHGTIILLQSPSIRARLFPASQFIFKLNMRITMDHLTIA